MTKILKVTIDPAIDERVEECGVMYKQVVYAPIVAMRQDVISITFILNTFPIDSEDYTSYPISAVVTVRKTDMALSCNYAEVGKEGLKYIDIPVRMVEIVDEFPVDMCFLGGGNGD